MNETDALKGRLADMTRLYTDDRVPVRFAKQPHYAGPNHGGPYLAVNPDVNGWYDPDPPVSGANELRLLRDTLSHEAYEYNMGHPDAKAGFVERHGDTDDPRRAGPTGKAAGQIYNILRDAWVNSSRCSDYPGLRRTFAFKADLLTGDVDVSERPAPEALLAGLHQIALTNTAHGVQNADDEVRDLLAWARNEVEAARSADGHPELMAIADRVFERFEPFLPDAPDDPFEDLLDALDDVSMDLDAAALDAEDVSNAMNLADPPEDLDSSVTVEDVDDAALPDDDAPSADDADPEDPDDLPEQSEDDTDADGSGTGENGDEAGEDDAQGGAGGGEGRGTDDGQDGTSGGSTGERDEADGMGDPQAMSADAAGRAAGGDSTTDASASDDLSGLLDDMDDLADSDRPAGDAFDLDPDDDYHEPEQSDQRRYERLQDSAQFAGTDLSNRMKEREDYSRSGNGDLSADEIQELMRETGLARDVRRAFEQIKTREVRETTRRQTQDMNLNNVVRHMAGEYSVRDVYETTERGASGGRTICAVVDGSGSMKSNGSIGREFGAGGAIVDAKVALAALHLATHEIGDDFVANVFDTYRDDDVGLVTGPNETFEWSHLDAFTGCANKTPTAAGVMDGRELLDQAGGKERVMVVITDGHANTTLAGTRWSGASSGNGSAEDARKAVELARQDGIQVIGVGVGSGVSDSKLRVMFGENSWVHIESDTLVEDLVRIYADQLDHDTNLTAQI